MKNRIFGSVVAGSALLLSVACDQDTGREATSSSQPGLVAYVPPPTVPVSTFIPVPTPTPIPQIPMPKVSYTFSFPYYRVAAACDDIWDEQSWLVNVEKEYLLNDTVQWTITYDSRFYGPIPTNAEIDAYFKAELEKTTEEWEREEILQDWADSARKRAIVEQAKADPEGFLRSVGGLTQRACANEKPAPMPTAKAPTPYPTSSPADQAAESALRMLFPQFFAITDVLFPTETGATAPTPPKPTPTPTRVHAPVPTAIPYTQTEESGHEAGTSRTIHCFVHNSEGKWEHCLLMDSKTGIVTPYQPTATPSR